MLYEELNGGKQVKVRFQDDLEVGAVSSAFMEHNDHVVDLGNTPTGHQRKVAEWKRAPQDYKGPNILPLIEKLTYYVEQTDEVVDDLLDSLADGHERIEVVGRRMQLGATAAHLLESLEVQLGMDAALEDILGS